MRLLPLLLLACCSAPEAEPPPPVHDTLAMATDLATAGAARWGPGDLYPGWIETVWSFGLHRLYAASGAGAWHDYYRDWMLDELPRFEGTDPYAFVSSDSMSPALVASISMLEEPTTDLSLITAAGKHYLDAVARRTDEGAITHWAVPTAFVDTDEVWIDSQFMFGVFLLREHVRTGDMAHLDRFVEQYLLFSDLCRDPADQLYRHAYDDGTDANIPEEAAYWARGNSWVLVAAAEALLVTEPGSPAHDALAPLFEDHVRAVLALQADDGLWHTVLNQPRGPDPANYTETSGSALIAYALAVGRRSVLSDELVLGPLTRAVDALEDRVHGTGADTSLSGTSYGTNPGTYEDYVSVPVANDLMLGLGAAVMALAEVHGLPEAE